MLCQQCREQIELGDAHTEVVVAGRIRYLHVGCGVRYNPIREREDAAREDEEFERIAQQARNVC